MLLIYKSRSRGSFCLLSGVVRSSSWRSTLVKTAAGDAFGASRRSIVSHETRQATTQHKAIQFAKRSAVARRSSSIRQPVFRVRKNVSIFQRSAYGGKLAIVHLEAFALGRQIYINNSVARDDRYGPEGRLSGTLREPFLS